MENSVTLAGMQRNWIIRKLLIRCKMVQPLWKIPWKLFQKWTYRMTQQLHYWTYVPGKQRLIFMQELAFVTTAPNQKLPVSPSKAKRFNELWYSHPMEQIQQ